MAPDLSSWLRQAARPLHTVAPGSDPSDLQSIRQMVGPARLVGLGEATHGTHEFFKLKHRIFEFLVNELDFSVLILEANFAECLPLYRYIAHGEGDPADALIAQGYWCWDCAEFLELVRWMRSWNATHQRQIALYGCDTQASAGAANVLLRYLRKWPTEYRRAQTCLLSIASDIHATDWAARTREERASIEQCLAAIDGHLATRSFAGALEQHELKLARIAANSIRQHMRLWEDPGLGRWWAVRDRAMAENIDQLMQLHGPDTKAVVWAHNSHIQLRPAKWLGLEIAPLGECLRSRFGKSYVACGLEFDHGSFGAIDSSYIPRTFSVCSAAGSFDASLAEAGARFVLDLRQAPADLDPSFKSEPRMRLIGTFAAALEQVSWIGADPRCLFDLIAFVRKTSAAQFHETAAYMYEFVRQEAPAQSMWSNLDFLNGLEGWRKTPQPHGTAYDVRVMAEESHHFLEVFRPPSPRPSDAYRMSQTIALQPGCGGTIRFSCEASIAGVEDGGSAQLIARASRQSNFGLEHLLQADAWYEPIRWWRAVTRSPDVTRLSVEIPIDSRTLAITVALVLVGDGRARFGPVTVAQQSV